MADQIDPKRLDALEKRLDAARKDHDPAPAEEHHISQAQAGWRMVTELVAGLLIGFGVGYGLDFWLGTTPLLMIVFIGLGFTAGIRTMMRTAAEIQKKNMAPPGDKAPAGKEEMYDDD